MTRWYRSPGIQFYGPGGLTMKSLGRRGVSLLELLVVIAVSGVLTGIAGFTAQGLLSQYDMERQVRQMQSDMMNARVQAFEKKRAYFITVTNSCYQITEDTNESGGTTPDLGDRALWSMPKQFKFHSQWNGTFIMKANGIISTSAHPLLANAALAIRFENDEIKPEYDCISVGPTRIKEGRWNGLKCAVK
jgi:prepilin-type N-terminal cleavage/methylation domain-containing protein